MSTLKICCHSLGYWLTDVKSITAEPTFGILDNDPCGSMVSRHKQDERMLGEAMNLSVAEFTPDVAFGRLIHVERHTGTTEHWIVPDGSCFLMNDSGRTIDRI